MDTFLKLNSHTTHKKGLIDFYKTQKNRKGLLLLIMERGYCEQAVAHFGGYRNHVASNSYNGYSYSFFHNFFDKHL